MKTITGNEGENSDKLTINDILKNNTQRTYRINR